jgi:drug/metabolite transporter (DMT)-like permease
MSFVPGRPLAYACLALSMTLVGSYVALSKPLVAVFPVFLLAWLRFFIGALGMLHWLRRPPTEAPLDARTRWLLFLESFLGNFLFSIFMLYGVSMTSAVSAGIILAALPAVVAVLSWGVLGERVERGTWAAVACAAGGIALLALRGSGGPSQAAGNGSAWLGNLLVFAAVLCEASYAVIGKKLTGRLGPRRITAIINLWGLALITPFGVHAALRFDFATVNPMLWAGLLFYAFAASIWSVWLWMTGLKVVPAARSGVFTIMLPLSAAAVGVLALGERFDAGQAAALALAIAAVVLATRVNRR